MGIAIELKEVFNNAEKINVLNEGNSVVYCTGEDRFNEVLASWNDMIKTARQMPAFGVSLDNEAQKAVKSGLWVEFDFGKTYVSNQMHYEKLLINVNKSWQGFNLIRYNSDRGYDGRCFYFALVGKDMSEFYDVLLK